MTASRTIWGSAGWHVRHVEETGSTNNDLIEAASNGVLADRSVLIADHQTAGRGRLDRRWDAPVGANLLMSIHLAESAGADSTWSPSALVPVVGLAAVRAVETLAGPPGTIDVGLKWPNDVLLNGCKLAGVLAQRVPGTGGVVIGVGLNVAWAPDGSARLHDLATLRDVTRPEVVDAMLHDVARSIERGPEEVAVEYRRRLLTLGKRVRVALPADRMIEGVATDVERDGRLIVTDDDAVQHTLDVGDVVHLRLA